MNKSKSFTLGNGRNFLGSDSQVFLPMITAFIFVVFRVVVVSDLKRAMSPVNFQGNSPRRPIPSAEAVAATITTKFFISESTVTTVVGEKDIGTREKNYEDSIQI